MASSQSALDAKTNPGRLGAGRGGAGGGASGGPATRLGALQAWPANQRLQGQDGLSRGRGRSNLFKDVRRLREEPVIEKGGTPGTNIH